jgi:hypothetical protein
LAQVAFFFQKQQEEFVLLKLAVLDVERAIAQAVLLVLIVFIKLNVHLGHAMNLLEFAMPQLALIQKWARKNLILIAAAQFVPNALAHFLLVALIQIAPHKTVE